MEEKNGLKKEVKKEVIKVENLVKKYKEHLAVDDISFVVNEGELFAFLGENGAGKTTTINILCTILKKTDGSVFVCGKELGKEDDEIRKNIGIVFQNSVLDKKLTVKENLITRGYYYGLTKKEIEKRLEKIGKNLEIEKIWNMKYEKLSGGQRRRVDIIRALLHNPKILFLDEPTTGLDPKSRKLVWDYIEYLRKEKNMTIFLTTHYMEETKDADQVVILDKGKIICKGTPSALKSRYTSKRLVWYVKESTDAKNLIETITDNYVYDADHYNIFIKREDKKETDNNNNDNDMITEFVYKYRDLIKDYEVIKGSMDDVFLNLTGKELRS
ncbi:multidrug/hemolysin transport system ATP-binding protein [Lachnospiraceae bacterium RM5]|nr:multidrug/hemolysin transport system ATP-binding protein [Lachnospiraceae bacterium RM5]